MRVVTYYSHLNGLEFLQVHKPGLWAEILDVPLFAEVGLVMILGGAASWCVGRGILGNGGRQSLWAGGLLYAAGVGLAWLLSGAGNP